MRIGLDCRLGGLAHAGIGRYIEQLVDELLPLVSDHHLVLFFSSQDQISKSEVFSRAQQQDVVNVVIANIPHYSLAEQTRLAGIFNQENLDLLHVPHFNLPILYRRPTVITIHDLLWHQYQGTGVTTQPKLIYWLKYLGYRLVSRMALTKARAIMVPTQVVKDEIISRYPQFAEKIAVTPEGVSTSRSKQVSKADFEKRWPQLTKPFLLSVGSLYPHKNVELILKSLADFPQLKLAIVGSRNIFQEQFRAKVKAHQLTDRVEFLGFVSDQELAGLYQHSLALVQPSLSEGFGLTGLEAMAMGARVLASDIEVFKEVYGPHALYFDPHSAASLNQMLKVAMDESATQRNQIIASAQKHTQRFSWAKLAQQTLACYRKVLQEKL